MDYPIWETNWLKLITIYPEQVRVTVLYDHLDHAAKLRLVGLEDDYVESMKKLKLYFGNPLKVVNCCLKEIATVRAIKSYSDYAGLVQFSRVIEQNHKRLQAIGHEKEIENTTVANEIVQRLPSSLQNTYMD